MGIEQARAYLKQFGADERIIELKESSATVALAAAALGVEEARIAKTLAFQTKEGPILVVAAGDARMDNKKFRQTFGEKMRMLPREETEEATGHAAGGVCPFGVKENVRVYLDNSLRRFDTVYPACGSDNSAIELSIAELDGITGAAGWVDLAKEIPQPGSAS